MGEDIVLMLALIDGTPIAGALNFLGSEALYGRYWGCALDKPFLHFEMCYYQAIELAIARGLARVEAGAQGPHKWARGYEPVQTFSAHWIADPGFRAAIEDFLERERAGVAQDQLYLGERTPFKRVLFLPGTGWWQSAGLTEGFLPRREYPSTPTPSDMAVPLPICARAKMGKN